MDESEQTRSVTPHVSWAYRTFDTSFINDLSSNPGGTAQLVYFAKADSGCVMEFPNLREFVLDDHLFVVPPGVSFRVLADQECQVDCVLMRIRGEFPEWFARFPVPTKIRIHTPGFFERLIAVATEFAGFGRVDTSVMPLLEEATKESQGVKITLANHAEGFPPHSVPRHSHAQEYQIDYYLKGRGRFLFAGVWEEISDGDVFYVPPHYEHAIEYDPDHEYHNLSLKWIPSKDGTVPPASPIRVRLGPSETELRSVLQRIVGSYLLSEPVSERDVTVVMKIVKDASDVPAQTDGKAAVQRAKAIVENNYAMRLELRWVASRVNLSPSYLSRIFRRETGTTFANFVRGVRLARSRRLLSESNYPVTDISHMCGFSSLHYFSQAFKNEYGISPREARASRKAVIQL